MFAKKTYSKWSTLLYENESNRNFTTQVMQNYSVFKYRPLSLPFNRLASDFLRNDHQSSDCTKKYKNYWYVPSVRGYHTKRNANALQNTLQQMNIVAPNKYVIFKRNYPSCENTSATVPQRVRIKEYKKRKSKLPPLCKACPRKVQLRERNKPFFKKLWSKLGFSSAPKKQPTNAPKRKQKPPDSQTRKEEIISKPVKIARCTAEFEDDVKKKDSALALNINSKLVHEEKSPQQVGSKEKIPKPLHSDVESQEVKGPKVELRKSERPTTEILKAESIKKDNLKAAYTKIKDTKAVFIEATNSEETSSTEQLKPAPSIDEKVANLCEKYNLDNIWMSDNIHSKKGFNNSISNLQGKASNLVNQASTSFSESKPQSSDADGNLDREIARLKSVNKELPCVDPGTSSTVRERQSVKHEKSSTKGEKKPADGSNSYVKLMSIDKGKKSIARIGKQESYSKNSKTNLTKSVTAHQEHKLDNETEQLNDRTNTHSRPENVRRMFNPGRKQLYESTDTNDACKESDELEIFKNRNLQTKPSSFDTAENNEVTKDRSAKQPSKYNITQDSPKCFSRKNINQENDSTLKSSKEQPFKLEAQNKFNYEESKIKNNLHQEPFEHKVQNIPNSEEKKYTIHQEPFKHLTMYEMLQKSHRTLPHKLNKNSVIDAVKTNNENINSGEIAKQTATSQIPYEVYSNCTYQIHPTEERASKTSQIPAPINDMVKLDKNREAEKKIDENTSVTCDVIAQITKVPEKTSQYQEVLKVAPGRVNPPNTIYKSNSNTQPNTMSCYSKNLRNKSPLSQEQHISKSNTHLNNTQITGMAKGDLKLDGLDNKAKCESSPDFKEILSCKLNITQEDSLNEVKVTNKDIENKQYQLRLTLSESNLDGQPTRQNTRESQNVDNVHKIQVKLDSSEIAQNDRTPRRVVNELKATHDRTRNFTTSAHQINEEFQLDNGSENRLRESLASTMLTKNCQITTPYNSSPILHGFNENKALSSKKGKSLIELSEKKSTNNLVQGTVRSNDNTADLQITKATTNNKTNFKKYCNELLRSKDTCNENEKTVNNELSKVSSSCNMKKTENKIREAPKEEKPPSNFDLCNGQSISELGDIYKNVLTSMLKLCQQTNALAKMPEQNDNYKNFQEMEVKYSIENCNHAIMNTESKGMFGAERNVSARSSIKSNGKNCTIKCSKSKKVSKVVHRVPIYKQDSVAQTKLRKQKAKSSKFPTQYIVDSTMLAKFIDLIKSDLVPSDNSEKYTKLSGDELPMDHEKTNEKACFKPVVSGDNDIDLIKSDLIPSDNSEKCTKLSGDKLPMDHEKTDNKACFKPVVSGDNDIDLIKSDLVPSDNSEKYTKLSGEKLPMDHEKTVEKACFKPVVSGDNDKKLETTPEMNNNFRQADGNYKHVSLSDIDHAEQLHKILSYKAKEFCSVMLELVRLFSSYKSSNEAIKRESTLESIQSQQNRIDSLKDTVKSIQNTIGEYFLMSGTSLNNCFSIGDCVLHYHQDKLFNQTTDQMESNTSLPSASKYLKIDTHDNEAASIRNKPNWYMNETDNLFSNNRERYERQKFRSAKR